MLLLVISRLWKLRSLPAKRRKVQQFKCVKGKATCNDVFLSLRGKKVNNFKIDRNIKRFIPFPGSPSTHLAFLDFAKQSIPDSECHFIL